MINDIVQIPIDWTCKVIVGTDHDKFLARLLELGEDYLEQNKIFAMLFDTTPLSEIETMKSYEDIIKHFPKSNRVSDKALYIGNYDKRDHRSIIEQVLAINLIKYEIVEFIECI